MNLEKISEMNIGITNAEYHSDKSRISKSGLDDIDVSPAHFYYKHLSPDRPEFTQNETLLIGSAFHARILEPEMFEENYAILDDTEICKIIGGKNPRMTNRYSDFTADFFLLNQGKEILTLEQFKRVERMRESLERKSLYDKLFRSGLSEQTFHFEDRETGVSCRIRPDRMTSDYLVLDLKTTKDSSQHGFMKSCIDFRYDVQDAFYLDGLIEVFGEKPKGFIFIACESMPPHNVEFYMMPKETKAYGRKQYKSNLKTYAECLLSGNWPGYNGEMILPINYPDWVLSK